MGYRWPSRRVAAAVRWNRPKGTEVARGPTEPRRVRPCRGMSRLTMPDLEPFAATYSDDIQIRDAKKGEPNHASVA